MEVKAYATRVGFGESRETATPIEAPKEHSAGGES
jgi:hypothetical protein